MKRLILFCSLALGGCSLGGDDLATVETQATNAAEAAFTCLIGVLLGDVTCDLPVDGLPLPLDQSQFSGPSASVLSAGAPVLFTVTLDWIAPTTNTDGSPLLDLSRYEINYADVSGPCCGPFPSTAIPLDNPGLVTYVLDLPGPGRYAISISAFSATNGQGEYSNLVSVTIE